MKIEVIGLDFIGLPTAILLSNSGYNVIGMDINKDLLREIKSGLYECEDKELDIMLKKCLANKKLNLTNQIKPADVYIIAVPTPVLNNSIDLIYLEKACRSVSKVLKKGDLVIIESTIAPGTINTSIKEWLKQSGLIPGQDFGIAHVPSRVQPGNAKFELIHNERIIGGIDEISAIKAKEIYLSFVKGNIELTDALTAETVKVLENTFRDVNIAFANEVLLICEKLGVSSQEVIKIANRHPRVNILNPGPGVGGHCIPMHSWFLIQQAPDLALLIKQARIRNNYMPKKVAKDIKHILNTINGGKVAILGCTYKADTSDDRESPSDKITTILRNEKIKYNIFDPYVKKIWTNGTRNIKECLENADLITLIIPHKQFVSLEPREIASYTNCRNIYDCTGCLDVEEWKEEGFIVKKLGYIGYMK